MPKEDTKKEKEEVFKAPEVAAVPDPTPLPVPVPTTEEVPAWAKALQEQVEGLKKENEMLKDITGKSSIKSWELAQRDFKNKFAHFKVFKGKIIISWGDLDYSKFEPKAKDARSEKVFTTVQFLDGTSETINYVDFNNAKELLKVKVQEMRPDSARIEFPPDVVKQYELNKSDFTVLPKFLNA